MLAKLLLQARTVTATSLHLATRLGFQASTITRQLIAVEVNVVTRRTATRVKSAAQFAGKF